MPRTRPRYPPEVRREAIKLLRISTKSQQEIAEDLGISGVTLRNWVKRAARDERKPPDGLPTDEREELARLRRENQKASRKAADSMARPDPRQRHHRGGPESPVTS